MAEVKDSRSQWRGAPTQQRLQAFDRIWLPVPSHQAILKEVSERIAYVEETQKCEGILVICESGGGKTSLCKELLRRYPTEQGEDRTVVPAVIMKIPKVCTRAGLARCLLEALGDPAADSGNAEKNLQRALKLMRSIRLKVLAVDNFQDIPERRSTKGVRVVGNWFRDLLDESAVVLLALGTEQAKKVRYANDQVRRRIPTVRHVPYFTVEDEKKKIEWLRVLNAFDTALPLAEPSGLATAWFATRLFYASNGIFDYLAKLLKRAMARAVSRGSERIEAEDLVEAFGFVAGDVADQGNPFSTTFASRDLNKTGELFYKMERSLDGAEQEVADAAS